MTIKFATLTAMATIIASSAAFAGSDTTSTTMKKEMEIESSTVFDRSTPDNMKMNKMAFGKNESGYFVAEEKQILASNLLGKNVYNGPSDDAEAIGDVNDVIMGPDGQAMAVIIGVGGFLGLGEKDVAVDFDRVSWLSKDDEKTLMIDATKMELENAPAYERGDFTEAAAL